MAKKATKTSKVRTKNTLETNLTPFISSPNTYMGSEYFVTSALLRMGYDASLVTGSQKSADIMVFGKYKYVTLDVKGSIAASTYRVNNLKIAPNHFYVFITFNNAIEDLSASPTIYVVPSADIPKLYSKVAKDKNVNYPTLRKNSAKYLSQWQLMHPYLV